MLIQDRFKIVQIANQHALARTILAQQFGPVHLIVTEGLKRINRSVRVEETVTPAVEGNAVLVVRIECGKSPAHQLIQVASVLANLGRHRIVNKPGTECRRSEEHTSE